MSKSLLISLLLVIVIAFTAVWLFEPAVHYYESVNVNTMDSNDYTMTDRYTHAIFTCRPYNGFCITVCCIHSQA